MLWHVYSIWAVVEDPAVVKKMTESIVCTTVGSLAQSPCGWLLYPTSKRYEDCAKNPTFYSIWLLPARFSITEMLWWKLVGWRCGGVVATNLGIHCARAVRTWRLPFPLHLLSTYPGTLYGYPNQSFKSLEWKVGILVPKVLRSNAACSNSFICSKLCLAQRHSKCNKQSWFQVKDHDICILQYQCLRYEWNCMT